MSLQCKIINLKRNNMSKLEDIRNWESATIENTDWRILNALFKDPPKKKKKTRSDKKRKRYRLDSRLKIWRDPLAHSSQRWDYWRTKERNKARLAIFPFIYEVIYNNL